MPADEGIRAESLAALLLDLLPDDALVDGLLRTEALLVDMPVEFYPRRGDDSGAGPGLRLEAGPPSQTLATAILPVLHRVRLRLEAEPDGHREDRAD